MAALNLDQMSEQAVELLPAVGQTMEFDAYKAKLYAQFPESGRDVFSHLIRNDIVAKKLARGADGKPVVLLSRKA